jgi:hypothetical protein
VYSGEIGVLEGKLAQAESELQEARAEFDVSGFTGNSQSVGMVVCDPDAVACTIRSNPADKIMHEPHAPHNAAACWIRSVGRYHIRDTILTSQWALSMQGRSEKLDQTGLVPC